MRLRAISRRIIHRAVVQARLEFCALVSSSRMIVQVRRLIIAVAAPGQVPLNIAMPTPPAIPQEQRLESLLKEPAVVELPVQAKHGDGPYRSEERRVGKEGRSRWS